MESSTARSVRRVRDFLADKQNQVVMFASTAIALYGYDQGMMSLINTNHHYLATMGLGEDPSMVGIIVSIYYLGCAAGSVMASAFANAHGRKRGMFACLAMASLGNVLMFVAGLGYSRGARTVMLIGRVVMGLGVGGIDAVVPVYSSELSETETRGEALAKEFQANIFGLNSAFILNVVLTHQLGKTSEWAWRIPIITMQLYPAILFAFIARLPESPRWCVFHGDNDKASKSLDSIMSSDQAKRKLKELIIANQMEQDEGALGYLDLLLPSGSQFHPTCVAIMGQVNQALTGYGAVSVYGPQIFALLGFDLIIAEYFTLGNYVFYFGMMTFAWLLIDVVGRRWLLLHGAFWLSLSFLLLTVLGGLAYNREKLGIPMLSTGIPGCVILYLSTATFGIGWLVPPWLIPTEIYPSTCRAQGAAVSVIIWGFANFAVTLLTPIGFNNLKYWLFLVFCVTNAISGVLTWAYCPETGGRSFEDNQEFFKEAHDRGRWAVRKVKMGQWLSLPDEGKENGEHQPLMGGISGIIP